MLPQKISELKEKILSMAKIITTMVTESINALTSKNEAILQKILHEYEPQVNDKEIEIENLCIQTLALHQPEALDLRTVTMIMKINNDLERIGDHAVNIAGDLQHVLNETRINVEEEIITIYKNTIEMLNNSISSFVNGDPELAIKVCEKDQEIDNLRNKIIKKIIKNCISSPACDESLLDNMLYWILIAKNFERIGDLATNIAEDVVYIYSGKIIKHHYLEKQK
jgi:phosphate transport system protein